MLASRLYTSLLYDACNTPNVQTLILTLRCYRGLGVRDLIRNVLRAYVVSLILDDDIVSKCELPARQRFIRRALPSSHGCCPYLVSSWDLSQCMDNQGSTA